MKSGALSKLTNCLYAILLLLLANGTAYTQVDPDSTIKGPVQVGGTNIDLETPRDYVIGRVTAGPGIKTLDFRAITVLAELEEGKTIRIPGEAIPKAIKKLWEQKLFSNIKINVTGLQGNYIFLEIDAVERPRTANKIQFFGIKKKDGEKLREQLEDYSSGGKLITEDLLFNIRRITRNYFVDKGYYNTEVSINTQPSISPNAPPNALDINVNVKKGNKVKINDIRFVGVNVFKKGKLYRSMKDTKRRKWWRVWKASKFMDSDYRSDKQKIIDKYNNKGYRDAEIAKDTVYAIDDRSLNIEIKIEEGRQYYFGNITWIGNSIYRSGQLDSTLNIKKGDVYNQAELESRLFGNPSGTDISSLYLNRGYLFFSVTPVEIGVHNDTIDYEMRITEGKQARIRDIIIKGNTKTNDHIIRREIRTYPGDLFDREAIMRTQRELAQMQYFNPEKLGVNPIPDPISGTVDIEYTVEEKPSDQVQLSGGWGGGRIIGTLGLTINNFSIKNIFKGSAWQPIPSGDGQSLSLSAQSNGAYYQGYNLSFIEPWLGGRKPNSLSVNGFHTYMSNDTRKFSDPLKERFKIWGSSIGLGKRLKWPDDYFTMYNEVSYQYYDLQNYTAIFSFSDGYVNNLAYRFSISRNSVDAPLYPRSGSTITFSAKATLPYSLLNNKDYSTLGERERFKYLEYAKLKFTTSHFMPLSKDRKLVLNVRTGMGLLLPWNKKVGDSPFERFSMGGSGLSGMGYMNFGRELIAMRGYDDGAVSSTQAGDPYIVKYTMELRYPISLNPSATVYVQGFLDAGKTWTKLREMNPFDVYRSGGVGLRLFLPMFGMLGFDYGWRFDTVPNRTMQKSQFHFTIGMNLGEL